MRQNRAAKILADIQKVRSPLSKDKKSELIASFNFT